MNIIQISNKLFQIWPVVSPLGGVGFRPAKVVKPKRYGMWVNQSNKLTGVYKQILCFFTSNLAKYLFYLLKLINLVPQKFLFGSNEFVQLILAE
jgi:hypothetical protein